MMDLTHLNEDNMVIRYNNQRQNLLLLKSMFIIIINIFFFFQKQGIFYIQYPIDGIIRTTGR